MKLNKARKKYQDFFPLRKNVQIVAQTYGKIRKMGRFTFVQTKNVLIVGEKDPKVSNHRCPQCHKKMVIIEGKMVVLSNVNSVRLLKKIPDKKNENKND